MYIERKKIINLLFGRLFPLTEIFKCPCQINVSIEDIIFNTKYVFN